MNLFDLKNNPLFLQSFRERNRFSGVVSAITLLLVVVIVLFLSAFMNENYVHYTTYEDGQRQTTRLLFPWFKKLILDLATVQGIVILLFGSVNAFRMASRERISGTIDFHRSSPTPRRNQIAGLLLGSTSMEWWIFAVIFTLQIVLSIMHGLYLPAILIFNVKLIFCGLLYHSLSSLLGICRHPHQNKAGAFIILIGLYFFFILLTNNKLSFLSHLTWLGAYQNLEDYLKGMNHGYHLSQYQRNLREMANVFFGIKFNTLLFQLFVQVPVIALFLDGIGRRFQNLEQPIFSKSQTLMATFFILFLYCGSFTSLLLAGTGRRYSFNEGGAILWVLIIILGIIGSVLATPSQLSFVRGLRRVKKQGLAKIQSHENAASNVVWMGVFAFIAALSLAYVFYLYRVNLLHAIIGITIILSYIIFFASYMEFFQLSRHHAKKAIAFTVLIILWIFVPLTALILKSIIGKSSVTYLFMVAPSPFFGGLEPVSRLIKNSSTPTTTSQLLMTLAVPALLAAITATLAYAQRKRLMKDHLELDR